jgi:pimeloyl-ACP methyl ester carboxylesterase
MNLFRVVSLMLLAGALAACNSSLARQMVTAPNRRLSSGPDTRVEQMKDGRFFVAVGNNDDPAVIAGWIIEPKRQPAKGAVLVLHGFLADHSFIRSAAENIADAGYRAIMVDLRGHGESTGRHITFGVVEAHDMVAVLDYLQQKHLAGADVGVYGTSLGAAVALQWAAIDPRVKAVVSIASFATLKDEAPRFARTILPLPGLFLSKDDMTEILARAGEIAHFNVKDANPLIAITHTHASILLIHGDDDAIIPTDDSRRLHAAAPASELITLPMHGHWAVSYDWGGDVSRLAIPFFDKHLSLPTASR